MMCEYYSKVNGEYEKDKTEAEKLLKHFKDEISKETEEFVINTVFKHSRYIFIRKEICDFKYCGEKQKVKKYFAYCTHCKKEYEVSSEEIDEDIKHNHSIICQECGSKCTAKYTRYRRGSLIDRAIFITYDKSAIDSETIIARGYFVTRDYTKDYKKVETKYFNLSRYVFEPGKSSMITYNYSRWGMRNGCCSYKDGYGNYRDYTDRESIVRAINNTRFRYSPYKRYMGNDDMTKFFYAYNNYPIIEKLIKIGFEIIADCMVYGRSLERAIRWKQTDVFKFLKLNRAEVKEIKAEGVRITPRFLNVYKFNRDESLKWDIKTIEKMADSFSIEKLKEIKKYSGVNRVIKYCEKQINIQSSKETRYHKTSDILRTWFDYLGDCKKLDLDMKDNRVLFPKSLYRAHQNTIKQIRYTEDKELNIKIKKLAKKRNKYKFEYKDLLIRPAIDTAELIGEGKVLSHCVGGYANRYADGSTTILFIRKKKEEDKPFYTVEIKEDRVMQVRGKHNINPDEEVKEFMEAYKEAVLNKTKKNKKVA